MWPAAKDGRMGVTAAQLSLLPEGIDWRMPRQTWRPLQVGQASEGWALRAFGIHVLPLIRYRAGNAGRPRYHPC